MELNQQYGTVNFDFGYAVTVQAPEKCEKLLFSEMKILKGVPFQHLQMQFITFLSRYRFLKQQFPKSHIVKEAMF